MKRQYQQHMVHQQRMVIDVQGGRILQDKSPLAFPLSGMLSEKEYSLFPLRLSRFIEHDRAYHDRAYEELIVPNWQSQNQNCEFGIANCEIPNGPKAPKSQITKRC